MLAIAAVTPPNPGHRLDPARCDHQAWHARVLIQSASRVRTWILALEAPTAFTTHCFVHLAKLDSTPRGVAKRARPGCSELQPSLYNALMHAVRGGLHNPLCMPDRGFKSKSWLLRPLAGRPCFKLLSGIVCKTHSPADWGRKRLDFITCVL